MPHVPTNRIHAGRCTITGADRYESSTHRIYIRSQACGGFLLSCYRNDSSRKRIDRQRYHTRAGALAYVKAFFRLPIAL